MALKVAVSRVATLALACFLVQGCADAPTKPTGERPPFTPQQQVMVLRGEVDADRGTLTFSALPLGGAGLSPVVYGNQGVTVQLYNTSVVITQPSPTVRRFEAQVGIRNLLGHVVGDEQAGASPPDTIGLFVFFISGPVVTAPGACTGCTVTLVSHHGERTVTAPNQKYFHWQERLAPAGSPGDTTRLRSTWRFEANAGVTSFRFDVLVSAPWPAPEETRWRVEYQADSVPESGDEPRWRLRQSGLGSHSANDGRLTINPPALEGERSFYRRDSVATGGSAYIEAIMRYTGSSTTLTDPWLVIDDGARFIALGIRSDSVGFISASRSFLGPRVAITTPSGDHTYQLRKYAADSAVFYVDGVRGGQLAYSAFPTTNYAGTAPLLQFGSAAGGASVWDGVIYEIGVASPNDTPANQRPIATMALPAAGSTYKGGDVITYSGSATDPDEGSLPAERLSWQVDFHHDTHTHPFLPLATGTAGGTVTIPTVGETSANVWYRFYLIATDASGLADTVVRDVQPRKVTLSLATQPAGLQVTLDGQPQTTPLSVSAVVGLQRELGVVSPQIVGSTTYTFSSWSDGGSATHTITTPDTNATYTATYTETPNTPPAVSLTAPANGGSAQVNTPVTVSADASDTGGSIQHVEFFDGTTSIGTDATSPYSIIWTPTTTGTRNLTARATDNLNAQTTSAPVSFTVTPAPGSDTQAPVVTLTAPADGATNLTGAVTLTATATDNVGVAGVQFQVDGENLGVEDTSAPYSATVPSTAAYTTGIHVLRARARDAAGNLSTWDVATVTFGGSVNIPAGFSRTTYTSGLTPPTAMAFAPDGRLFICQQNGQIRVVPAGGGTLLSAPFHTFTVTNSGEQGLLGIEFHPNFTSNGWIYVYYTSPTPVNHNRISRVQASAANPNVSTGVETILLDDLRTVPVGRNHNGGALHFSPVDGKLYVAIGDQASGSNAQSMTERFGKVLRYNDDLTIPTDNPFYATATGVNRAIWALGLRNPFTFAFQPTTGRLFINDVGEASWEEINEGVAGSNYGWPTTEGATTNPAFRGPIYAYPHTGDQAIVGAAFYNPATRTFPASYVGHYFFGDYVDGWINRLDPNNDNAVYAFARADPGDNIFGLEVGPDGALYSLSQRGTTFVVYRYQFQ
jgi:glucose/arabinose dehydrogenase